MSGVLLAVSAFLFDADALERDHADPDVGRHLLLRLGRGERGVPHRSETWPIEIRSEAIAVFFAIGTIAGALGPAFYGALIGDGTDRTGLFIGYLVGAGIMIIGGVVEIAHRDQRRGQVPRGHHQAAHRRRRAGRGCSVTTPPASVEEVRFRGQPAVTRRRRRAVGDVPPGPRDDGGLAALPRPRAPRAARRPRRAAGRCHARPAAARPVGQPAGVAPLPGGRRRRRPRRAAARHRRQRAPDPRPARRPTGMARRRRSARRGRASFRAAIDVDAPAFPFPHRIEVAVAARDRRLTVDTTVVPTGPPRGSRGLRLAPLPALAGHAATPLAPAAAGAHPPRARRPRASRRAASRPRRREAEPIGRRTFDDLYRLGPRPRLALAADDGVDHDARRAPAIRTPRCGCRPAARSPRSSR